MRSARHLPLVVAALLAPAALHAQPADAHKAAEEAFKRARDAMKQGDCKRAIKFLRTSQSLEPGRGKEINIAICEEELGELITAMRHFQEVGRLLPAGDERIGVVKKHLEGLAPRVPRLRLDLARDAPEGTAVKLDDAPLERAIRADEIPLERGPHTVVVTAPGRPERRYDVTIGEATSTTLAIAPGEVPPPAPPPTSGRRVAGFVVGGVGIAVVSVGAATGIAALVMHASLASKCPHNRCPANVYPGVGAQASTGHALSIASTAAFAVGLAGAGLGAFLVLGERSGAPASGVAVLAQGAGVQLRVRF
jgi:hypothetical protein